MDADDQAERAASAANGDRDAPGPAFPPPPQERGGFVEHYARLVYAAIGRALVAGGVGPGAAMSEMMEDLFAASFVAMFEDDARRLRLWDGRCSRESWVSLIAASVARDHLRAERRRERRLDRGADLQTIPDGSEIVDDREGLVARSRLERALASLAGPDRALLVALVLEERAPAEVADGLGISAGTLYTRKSRALTKLRAAFERLEKSEASVVGGKVSDGAASKGLVTAEMGARQTVVRGWSR